MSKDGCEQLPESLYQYMQEQQLVLLTTLMDQGKPFVNAISWTYAKTPTTIRFAVDQRSQIVTNIKQNPDIAMTIFHQETIYTISGQANILKDEIEGIPFKLALIEVLVQSVHEVMYYGSKISVQPQTEKTYNPEAAKKLDLQVLDALKNA
ncbi:pyridoxamine 5'-phosphate oxidase family protein [Tepidibacillus infernus]|uniref:pyridoxamine 5'-phosphate oxidase family protein n=1 Tax=Tepidibacillus infernus TaxID=1806172 RepID=UPI003A3D21E1